MELFPMSINKYLSMNLNQLYEHLISDILKNISEGKDIINDLLKTPRYQDDYEFRAVVDTSHAIILSMSGNDSKVQ